MTQALLLMDLQPGILSRSGAGEPYLDKVVAAQERAELAGLLVVLVRVAFRAGHPEISPHNKVFLDVFFRCSASLPDNEAATGDGTFFCDPAIDAQMDAADQQESTHPAQAALTWAAVDREVTNDAPWVPLVNENWTDFLSARVANYQYNPAVGILLDQLTVRH